MAMRVATMSPVTHVDGPAPARESGHLFRRLVLLVLLVVAAAAWIAVLFQRAAGFPLLLSTFFADASLGLIAGFGSRLVLYRRDWIPQLLIGLVTATIGMLVIGHLTNWVLGVGPIELQAETVQQIRQVRLDRDLGDQLRGLKLDSRRLLDMSKMNWADPVHLAVSLMMAVLSLWAWRRPAARPEPVELAPLPAPPPRPARSRRASSASSNGRARVQLPGGWLTGLRPGAAPGLPTRSSNGRRAPVLKGSKGVRDPVVRPKRRRSRRKPHIQFALVEEHRCPYCLDTVTHNDPRGVKECDVCHTLHHADCWAITGVCQVPHLNT